MYRPFRHYHILCIFEGYERQGLPLDLFLKDYFRARSAVGSKDRSAISDVVYTMVRWRGLLDYLCDAPPTWEKRLDIFLNWEKESLLKRADIPLHVRLSFPKVLFDLLVDSHGLDAATEICKISNTAAPTTLRVNTHKTSREELLARWKDAYQVIPCRHAKNGVVFEQKINFFDLPEFKEGLFEIQDEGSQLLADLMQVRPGQLVMDYCAGAGGKTLAFAPLMQNKGQIYLHDIRKHALMDSRKRLRRAGIQNAQIVQGDDDKLKKLKKNMDWVLVDAPCTGTGTMRRNPDMKWKFNEELLKNMLSQQRVIFERALSFLKPDGRIVYATCSLLKAENSGQIAHFTKTYGLEVEGNLFECLPVRGGMDGFFGVVLKKCV